MQPKIPLICIVAVTKAAAVPNPNILLFDNMNITLPTNRICAVLGRQGSGRSMFLRLLGRLEQPDAGAILTQARFSVIANHGSMFHPGLTGIENIALAARVYGLDSATLTEIALEITNFGPAWQMKAGSVIGRMRRSMETIVSALLPFDCFLLDDVERVEPDILQVVLELLHSRHAGMIFTAHNPKFVRLIASCASVITGQSMQAFETVEEAIQNYA